MIKLENYEVMGWEHVIRGMRNPMNSWDRSDTHWCNDEDVRVAKETGNLTTHQIKQSDDNHCIVGPNDHDLMMRLVKGGPVHAKYRRMITVYLDITAPLYWWKEFDTYKVGTVANSCSTMHKLTHKKFGLDDFSHEHLLVAPIEVLGYTISELNYWRDIYINGGEHDYRDGSRRIFEPEDKDVWWQMIQLLPSSYNQKRTVMLSYEVLANIYKWRKNHKLDEWREFCEWIEKLPYSEIITGEVEE